MMLLKRLSIMLKYKLPDITNLATNTTLTAKINEAKSEIPSITSLAIEIEKDKFYCHKSPVPLKKYLYLTRFLLVKKL